MPIKVMEAGNHRAGDAIVKLTDKTLWFVAGVWFVLLSGTLFAMAEYDSTEGTAGQAPALWPAIVKERLHTDPDKPTLVLFAHPLCPCTRATLWELEDIANRLYGLYNTHVLFFRPEDTSAMPQLWAASELKTMASRLPGVVLHDDAEGVLAKHFGAYTSGQVLLYNSDGHLQFAGGITPSRGHVGANAGSATLISAIVSDKRVDSLSTVLNPVYGCSLHEDADSDRKISPKQLNRSVNNSVGPVI